MQASLNQASQEIDEYMSQYRFFEDYYGKYYVPIGGSFADLYGGSLSTLLISACAASDRVRARTEELGGVTSGFVASITSSGTLIPAIYDVTRDVADKFGSEDAKKLVVKWEMPSAFDNQRNLGTRLRKVEPRLETKLNGAWQTLRDHSKMDRFLQAGSSMRELISDTLHLLAPDEEVRSMSWFRPETEDGKPTQRQRAYYAMVGKNNEIDQDDLIATEELSKDIRESYRRLNKYAHLRDYAEDLEQYVVNLFNQSQVYLLKILEIRDRFFIA